jgi:hypothetical protein
MSELYQHILECRKTWEAIKSQQPEWKDIEVLVVNPKAHAKQTLLAVIHPKTSDVLLIGYWPDRGREEVYPALTLPAHPPSGTTPRTFSLVVMFPTETGPNGVYVDEDALHQLTEDEWMDLVAMELGTEAFF